VSLREIDRFQKFLYKFIEMINLKLDSESVKNTEYFRKGRIMKEERAAVLALGLVYFGRFKK
jgi:hypothetical protein